MNIMGTFGGISTPSYYTTKTRKSQVIPMLCGILERRKRSQKRAGISEIIAHGEQIIKISRHLSEGSGSLIYWAGIQIIRNQL